MKVVKKAVKEAVSEETRQEPAIPEEPPVHENKLPDPTVTRDKKAGEYIFLRPFQYEGTWQTALINQSFKG